MKQAIKITIEVANEIIESQRDKPLEQVCICYQAQWYDIRGMTYEERDMFINSLINKDTKIVNINL